MTELTREELARLGDPLAAARECAIAYLGALTMRRMTDGVEQTEALIRDLERASETLPALLHLAQRVMDAPVVPISRQVDFPASPPLSWDSPCFETTYARILECDESGMVPVPTKGE